MNKIHVIGDIHGQVTMLKELMDKVLYLYEDGDILVFLGDYIDRGENSCDTVEYLIYLQSKYNCIFLLGNHEDMFMDFLSGINRRLYIQNGGSKTLYSYDINVMDSNPKIPKSHLEFYTNLKRYYETDEYIFVHAGFIPFDRIDKDKQDNGIILWVREDFYKSNYDFGKTIIFGHTPVANPMFLTGKIDIDTGACFKGGRLTCLTLPDKTYIQTHKFKGE